jgi:glucose/arabinose dehydrogenase
MSLRHLLLTPLVLAIVPAVYAQQGKVLTGQDAFTDYSKESPGIRRLITVADLPKPFATESSNNSPRIAPKPDNAWPIAPAGFKVELYAQGDFRLPRLIRFAPNGDLFLADTGAGSILVLRGVGPDGKAKQVETFATGLPAPFGINFYPADNPKWVYIGNTGSVVRFPYHSGDLKASGPAETIVPDLPAGGGHSTRDIAFSGARMFVSVGSASNVNDPDTHPNEFHRANILEYTPEGKFVKIYAAGIRNPVGLTINPTTGELWCSVNERDELGDNLVPDYVTSVKEGGFYGWPWYYMGNHQDPRLPGAHPELASKVIVPDILLQPHFASLELTFYPTTGGQFPADFHGQGIVAEHGSWNKSKRGGYEVIRIPMQNGHATGEFEDFLTGFVTPDGQVWGRPVGVAVAKDGSLFVSDDGYRAVWHITYTGAKR